MKKSTDCKYVLSGRFYRSMGWGNERIKDSCAEAGKPMPEYVVKEEDILVTFKSLTTDAIQNTTQADINVIENSIPMRILRVIKDNPTLSQSQIAEMLGEKHDAIKYHMREMRKWICYRTPFAYKYA